MEPLESVHAAGATQEVFLLASLQMEDVARRTLCGPMLP